MAANRGTGVEFLEPLKGAGPWAAFLLLAVLVVLSYMRGWIVSRREYDAMKLLFQGQLREMTEQRDGYRNLVNDQVVIDRRRAQVLDDALEGSRVITQALQAREAPRVIESEG